MNPATAPAGPRGSRALLIACFAAVYIVWGSTYLGIRIVIETQPPLLMAGTRFLIAGAVLCAWAWMRGAPRPTPRQWRGALLIGALLLLGGNGTVTWAEKTVPSSLAALLVSTTPFWMVMLDWLWRGGRRPTAREAAGIVIGFGGVAMLVAPLHGMSIASVSPLGAVLLVAASVSWATGSILRRTAPAPPSPALATGMEMLAGGALLTLAGIALGELPQINLHAVSARSAAAYLYLVVFGSVVAFSAYMHLLPRVSVPLATSHSYVNPVVAVLLGWALGGEVLTPRMLVAGAIIIAAVALLTVRKPAEEPDPSAA
jgi:drug/metabolite transporter (DMT)-like permease